MGIYGYRDIGPIPMMDISGYLAYGYFHHNPDSYGHPLIGVIQEVIMVFILATGDLMSVSMAV
jgi:hypothetical protein